MNEAKTPNRNGDIIDWTAIGEEARKPSKAPRVVFDHMGSKPPPGMFNLDMLQAEKPALRDYQQKMLDSLWEEHCPVLGMPACTHSEPLARSTRANMDSMREPYADWSDKWSILMAKLREKLFASKTKTWPEGVEPTERTAMILVSYKNWRGAKRERHVKPIAVVYGSTKWHKEPQWLLRAVDPEDGTKKSFALKDCDFTPASRTSLSDIPMFKFDYDPSDVLPHMHEVLKKYDKIDYRLREDPRRGGFAAMYSGHPVGPAIHPKMLELVQLYILMTESFENDLVTCEFRTRYGPANFHELSPESRGMAHAHIEILRSYMYARAAMYGYKSSDFDNALRETARRHRGSYDTKEGDTLTILGMVVRVLSWPFKSR